MKFIKYLLLGIFFGIVMTKSEAISWFRIHEMFLFDSFHMYGIIGTAVILGILFVYLIKRTNTHDIYDEPIKFSPKAPSIPRYLTGGIIFGLGWAMTGACPGPMYTLIGHGYFIILVIIASALLGTWVYGLVKSRLPH